MMIRQAKEGDIPKLAALEKNMFGDDGYTARSLKKMFYSFPQGFLVIENEGKITGFTFFEVLEKNEMSDGFRLLEISEPITGKWAHCLAFTTESQYRERVDAELLQTAEKIVAKNGCAAAYVPLPIEHKHPEAYTFWESHGYEKIGKIAWDSHTGTSFESYFCRKVL